MVPSERWEIVKGQKACFSCLKGGKRRTAANCSCREECSEKNSDGSTCRKSHHKLLHSEGPSGSAQIASLQDKSMALLLVLMGGIKAQQNADLFTEATMLLDSGAQLSTIQSDLAETLGLESKLIKILILKVGGIAEELTTKMYKSHVCSVDGKTVQVIQAVGIPQVSSAVSKVDVTALANLFGLGLNQIKPKAGQIDVLIRFHQGAM